MYKRILSAVEHSEADRTILDHIQPLAKMCGSSLVVVHVADGWAARAYHDLNLRESAEIVEDRAYLARVQGELMAAGFDVTSRLAMGEPATEIVRLAEAEGVDLVAMATHGHGFIKDIILGETVDKVRHALKVPVLLLRSGTG